MGKVGQRFTRIALQLRQDPIDVGHFFDRIVVDKMQPRVTFEFHQLGELAANRLAVLAEKRDRGGLVVADHRISNVGVIKIGRGFDARQSDGDGLGMKARAQKVGQALVNELVDAHHAAKGFLHKRKMIAEMRADGKRGVSGRGRVCK